MSATVVDGKFGRYNRNLVDYNTPDTTINHQINDSEYRSGYGVKVIVFVVFYYYHRRRGNPEIDKNNTVVSSFVITVVGWFFFFF